MTEVGTKDRRAILDGPGYLVQRDGQRLNLAADEIRPNDVIVGLGRVLFVVGAEVADLSDQTCSGATAGAAPAPRGSVGNQPGGAALPSGELGGAVADALGLVAIFALYWAAMWVGFTY